MNGIERIANIQMGNAHGPDPHIEVIVRPERNLRVLSRRFDDPREAFAVLSEYKLKAITPGGKDAFDERLGAFLSQGRPVQYSVERLKAVLGKSDEPVQAVDYASLVGGASRRVTAGPISGAEDLNDHDIVQRIYDPPTRR